MSDYLQELNEEQRAAVLYNEGPSLVIAGAGSGKTRVLTYKIAYLLENGYQPWNILALTFTNKAAREMKERIARQVGEGRARKLWMGTFHSMFLRILRTEASSIGFPPQFTIYDTADSKSLIRAIIKEMGLDEKSYKPGAVQARISNAKNYLVLPDAYANSRDIYQGDCAAQMPAVRDVYRRYWERCKQAGAMDFDDLLVYTYLLFRDHPETLARYREQFRYILVDEYQDTNIAQHSIVKQLAQTHGHVCVVGDDAQSIYSFRGADIDNILHFTQDYPNSKIFKLEQNYRSTQTIVCAANSLIQKNEQQIHKEVFSKKEKGEAISVFQAYSDAEEGEIIANTITELHRKEHAPYSDFAILYRTNAQSRVLEETLRKRGMPYRIYGGLSFYQRKEIKDIIAYFRLVVNPHDEEAFKRIVNYPMRGIGDTTVGKIIRAATSHNTSLWTVLCAPEDWGLNLQKGTLNKLQGFQKLIETLMEKANSANAYEAGLDIVKSSGILQDISQENSAEGLSRRENVEELMNGMSEFCAQRLEEGNARIGLSDYLGEVSLLTDLDSDETDDEERVSLMTIHAAKGLEFRTVFVAGLEENLFPNGMAGNSPRAMEEERRLFYVAITRAEKHCYLTYAKSRIRYGKIEFSSPSRFLRDIDTQFLQLPQQVSIKHGIDLAAEDFRRKMQEKRSSLETPQKEATASPKPSFRQPAAASRKKPLTLQEGQTIEHERFGLGEVLKVEGEGDNAKATIRFQNAGNKQLLLRFARFKIVK